MCQVSAFLKNDTEEELLKENVTSLEMLDKGIRMKTLFDGAMDFADVYLQSIDFSAGRIVLSKSNK